MATRIYSIEENKALGLTEITAFREDVGTVTVTLMSSIVRTGKYEGALEHALNRKKEARSAVE